MNEINGGSFRVSWKEDGVYQETLYLLDEEEIPVLRILPLRFRFFRFPDVLSLFAGRDEASLCCCHKPGC